MVIPKKVIVVILAIALLVIVASSATTLTGTGYSLTVYVKMDGVAVNGATVKATGPSMPGTQTTGGGGWVQFTGLDTGDYTVKVTTEMQSATQAITLSGTMSMTVNLEGAPIVQPANGVIRGDVTSEDGNIPQSGAYVKATRTDGYTRTVTSDANSNYYMELPEGTYTVFASITGYTSVTKTISVNTNSINIENFLIRNADATLSITVKDSLSQAKISGAVIVIGGKSFASDVNGIISVPDWKTGIYSYTISHETHETVSGSFTVGRGANSYTVSMLPKILINAVIISGKALNIDGTTQVANAMIKFSGAAGVFTAQTLSDGSYSVEVPSGTYTASATAEGFNETFFAGNPLTVTDYDVSGINFRMSGYVPPPDDLPYVWTAYGYLAAIGGIIIAALVVAFVPVLPKLKAFIALAIAMAGFVAAHLFNIGGI